MEKKCPQCGAPLPSGGLAGLCPACLLAQAANETAVPPGTAGFVPPTVAELAALFPQLEILSLIGKGGMGAVYQARQPALDRIVALKILPARAENGADFADRFNREARALAKLNHPNIVTVHEFGQVNGLPFFIMEYVDGLNLRQLEQAGKLSPREALQIVPQICEALQFAHDAGIVHRDIKPDNILVDKKGRVKIADFGIAKIMGAPPETGVPETQGAIGTPSYMAPEQIEKPQTVDHRADIFSLGVVFYEMLTGELPLGKFAPPSSGPRGLRVDVRLDDVVLRALEKEPDRRYQHASQVKTAVETIVGTPPGAPPPPPPFASAPAAPAIPPEEFLARDYTLSIESCLNRGWALMKAHFWELFGIHALIFLLLAIVDSAFARISTVGNTASNGTSILGLLLTGPLWAGLYLYFLKKMRGEAATVETAFAGFSKRFLHLFLVNLVACFLITLGFFCFIIPGVYLLVAWCFALVLVMDKGMDFWPAMELSRQVVQKHWWHVFALLLALAGVWLLGLLACCVGILVSTPVAIAVFLYAYEDIFGARKQTPLAGGVPMPAPPLGGGVAPAPASAPAAPNPLLAASAPLGSAGPNPPVPPIAPLGTAAAAGPSGPTGPIKPTAPPHAAVPSRPPGGGTRWFFLIPAVVVGVITALLLFARPFHVTHMGANGLDQAGIVPTVICAQLILLFIAFLFISLVVVVIIGLATGKWRYLKYVLAALATFLVILLIAVPVFLYNSFRSLTRDGAQSYRVQPVFPVIPVMPRMPTMPSMPNMPNMPNSPFAPAAPGQPESSTADYDSLLTRVRQELGKVSVEFDQLHVSSTGEHDLTISFSGLRQQGIWDGTNDTWKLITGSLAGNNAHSSLWEFHSQDQLPEVQFEIDGLDLAQVLAGAAGREQKASHESLGERLEAAENISTFSVKDKALSALAGDAAAAGDVEIVASALTQMNQIDQRDAATHDFALVLAKNGHRKEAVQMAEGISQLSLRDQTLAELAQ